MEASSAPAQPAQKIRPLRVPKAIVAGLPTTSGVVELLQLGFRPPLVAAELCVPLTAVRALHRQMFSHRPPGGAARSLDYVLRACASRREASFFAAVYMGCVESYGYRSLRTLGLRQVAEAYHLYLRTRTETELPKLPRAAPLNINDAHTVVQGLRGAQAMMLPCRDCQNVFLMTVYDEDIHSCPFCSKRQPTPVRHA